MSSSGEESEENEKKSQILKSEPDEIESPQPIGATTSKSPRKHTGEEDDEEEKEEVR